MFLILLLICITNQLFVIEGINLDEYLTPPKEFSDKNPTVFEINGTETEEKEAFGN